MSAADLRRALWQLTAGPSAPDGTAGMRRSSPGFGARRPSCGKFRQKTDAAREQRYGEAAAKALIGMATVEAVLANFPQSRLGPPNADWLQWYLDFVTSRGRNVDAILGHPDPRQGKHGAPIEGSVGDESDADLAEEQNEILFRGLSRLRQNFVFQVLAEHVTRGGIVDQVALRAALAELVARLEAALPRPIACAACGGSLFPSHRFAARRTSLRDARLAAVLFFSGTRAGGRGPPQGPGGCGRGRAGKPRADHDYTVLPLVRGVHELHFRPSFVPLFVERA